MRGYLLLAACAARVAPPPPAPPPPAPPPAAAAPPPVAAAPAFPAAYAPPGPDGAPVAFGQWAGQPVLVNLWASWCPPCIEELPALRALHAQWAPRGLVVVGVAIDDQPARVLATADARGMAWPQALDGSNRASLVFDTTELPTTLLYGPDGALRYKQVGVLAAQDPALEQALAQAVEQAGP